MSNKKENNTIIGRTLAGILPTIVSGLYSDKLDIVREYCQNAYDAILKKYGKDASTQGKIDIYIKGKDLIIHDNGTGMDTQIVSNLATIGYSTKDTFDQVGYRGIGRLSGICGAEAIHFVTKADSEGIEHTFVIDAASLEKALNRKAKLSEDAGEMLARFSSRTTKKAEPTTQHKSYTTVIMHNVRGNAGKLIDEVKLREYLELNLPIPVDPHYKHSNKIAHQYETHDKLFPNITILLCGRQLYKPYHKFIEANNFKDIILRNERGKTLAVAWFMWDSCTSRQVKHELLRGIRIRYRGFTVGQAGDMRNIIDVQPPQAPDWFAGEVIVVDERARVSSDRSRFEDDEMRFELYNEMHKTLGKNNLEKIARGISRKTSKERDLVKAEETLHSLKLLKGQKHVADEEVNHAIKEAKRALEIVNRKCKKPVDNHERRRILHIVKGLGKSIADAKNIVTNNAEIVKKCRLSKQAEKVYDLTKMEVLKYFDSCDSAAELITRLEIRLLKELGH